MYFGHCTLNLALCAQAMMHVRCTVHNFSRQFMNCVQLSQPAQIPQSKQTWVDQILEANIELYLHSQIFHLSLETTMTKSFVLRIYLPYANDIS